MLQDFGNRKTIVLWKLLKANGTASITGYRYGPGTHKLSKPIKKYQPCRPRGFHVYLKKPYVDYLDCAFLPVICNRDHFIRADGGEAVFSQILILKADWDRVFGKQ
jgi:hypothetical protein